MLFLMLVASPAVAQDGPRERFAAGVVHFEAGRFAEALAAFEDAYRLRPHPSVLVNIANCHLNLTRPLDAAVYFERYLREAGTTIESDARQDIELALARARVMIATIDVSASDGTVVLIDGERAGVTPLRRPIEVNPGAHTVELQSPHGEPRTTEIQLAPGEARRVENIGAIPDEPEPEPEPEPSVPIETNLEENDVRGRGPVAAWVLTGTAITAVAMTLGFGLKALSQQNDFDEIVGLLENASPGEEIYEILQADGRAVHETRKHNAIIADVMLAIGLTTASVAAYLFVRHRRSRGSDDDEPLSLAPAANRNGGGLVLGGEF